METILAIVGFQALTTALLLWLNQKSKGEDRFLVLLLIVMFVHAVYKIAILAILKNSLYFDNIHGSFSLLYGPLAFFYFRSILSKKLKLFTLLLHTTPFLVMFIANLLLLILVWLRVDESNIIYAYHLLMLVLVSFSFLGYGGYILNQVVQLPENTFLSIKYRLLQVISACIVGSGLLTIFGLTINFTNWQPFNLRYIFYGLQLLIFAAVIHFRFRIFLIDQRIQQVNDEDATDLPPAPSTEKYKHSRLSAEEMDAIILSIEKYFREKKPHLDSELTLDDLATKLQLNKIFITQALNLRLRQNFYQYVNNARVEESLQRIEKTSLDNMSAIGYESGFKSKSTFYKYFKERTGCSPTEYKKSLA